MLNGRMPENLVKMYCVGICLSTSVTLTRYTYHHESTWNKVNSFHSSLHGAVFWICNKTSVDNTPVFWLLLGKVHTTSRLSLLPTLPPRANRMGKHKNLGGNGWPELCSVIQAETEWKMREEYFHLLPGVK